MRLIRSVLPSSWRTNGMARPRAAIVAVRSAGWPMTLTHTLAWRRSGVRLDIGDRHEPDARIRDVPRQDRPDLLAQELIDPVRPLAHRTLPT